jgi:hypothetical protein
MERYDDNFGHWDDDGDEETAEFYEQVQRESVLKTCAHCGRQVRLRPEYYICNSCADAEERGGF